MKKKISTVITVIGIIFIILSLLLPIIEAESRIDEHTSLILTSDYIYYNHHGGIYMYMTVSGIVMLLGGILMCFFKNNLSIILSFIGTDLFFLPVFLTAQKLFDKGGIGIIGGADLPTFMLYFKGLKMTVSIIGLVLLIGAFILNTKLTKKK